MRISSLLWAMLCLAFAFPRGVLAWGPHSEITIAAAKALDKDDPILAYITNDWELLRAVAWMGDFASGNGIITTGGRKFYARDVAFFPSWHEFGRGHGGLGETGYEPVFRRVLQAIHTETPINAALWLGELIHMTEDTGCPLHAVDCNDQRHACEGWIDVAKIDIAGYTPQLLGNTDDEALKGYLARVAELHEFARQQADIVLPLATKGDREPCAAALVESALQCARVTADMLHTFGVLQAKAGPIDGTGRLSGTVQTQAGTDTIVAKIILHGTDYSTLSDAEGRYEFHNLPPTAYSVTAMRPGSQSVTVQTVVQATQKTTLDIALPPSDPPGNLLRNGDFAVAWMCQDTPDGWYRRDTAAEPLVQWYSEPFEVKPGQTFRLTVDWKQDAEGEVGIVCENAVQVSLQAGTKSGLFTIPENVEGFRGLAWISARTRGELSATFHRVAVTD